MRYGTSGYLPTPLTPVPRPPSPPRPGRHHWSDGHGDDHRGDDHHGDDDRPAWTGHDDHRWDDDDHDDGDDCDLRTFKVLDAGGNGIVMVEHIQQSHGTEVHVGVISYSYITGCPLNCVTTQAIVPKGTTKNFEWSVDKKTGKLQELEQSFSIGHGDGLRVWGHYDAKKNQTTIQRVGPYGFKKILPGLVLLDLATRQGKLVIEYNGIVAAIQP